MMVSADKIDLGKYSSTAKIGREIVDVRNEETIRNGYVVGSSIVTTWMPVASQVWIWGPCGKIPFSRSKN